VSRLLAFLLLALATFARADGTPDLVLDQASLGSSLTFEVQSFAPDACELQAADLCVEAPGARKLLRFDVFAINQGTDDVVLGTPSTNDPRFVYSSCHKHFHFESFAHYELRPRGGSVAVKTGQKRSFCVEDTKAFTSTAARKYTCTNQGIQVGWGDLYPANLPCQWIDVTDVSPGDYDLYVAVNLPSPYRIPELDFSNNDATVPVTIAAADKVHTPRVRVRAPHAHRKAHAGRRLMVAWKAHVRGGIKVQEVWFSADDGATYTLVANGLEGKKHHSYPWAVPAGTATDQGRIKVVVWSNGLVRGEGLSGSFRVVP
jgi:hypothetical protein